jgi:hypothetical protein
LFYPKALEETAFWASYLPPPGQATVLVREHYDQIVQDMVREEKRRQFPHDADDLSPQEKEG